MTLKFYGDESADETNSRVFSLAGVLGTEDDWAEAMRFWLRPTDVSSRLARCDRAIASLGGSPRAQQP